jgi:hypothetical protein
VKVFRWRDRCVKVTSEGAVVVGPPESAHRSMAKAPKQIRDYLADHGWNPERDPNPQLAVMAAEKEASEAAATFSAPDQGDEDDG